MSALPDPATFSSGAHGTVGGKRGALRRLGDAVLDVTLPRRRIRSLAARVPERDVIVTGFTPDPPGSARHRVRTHVGDAAELGGGKFENLNTLLAGVEPADWTLVVDDDVELPPDFLDGFIALCEAAGFELAQPAQTLASHAAWSSARRRPFSVARRTNFVEIGPVTAFSRRAADELLPFPDTRMGWGLDLHWGAVAAERGWAIGVVDALPVRHETRAVGSAYGTEEATAEAQRFLADRPYIHASEAGRTLRTWRRVPR